MADISAVAELAKAVVSPTAHATSFHERAGVPVARSDGLQEVGFVAECFLFASLAAPSVSQP